MVLGAVCLLALAAVYLGAVRTAPGQLADETALLGTHTGRRFIGTPVSWLLGLVSEEWLVVGTVVAVALALLRRRPDLAVTAAAVVLLGNVATQLLKAVLTFPDLGVEIQRPMENTLPSGHTTVATTIAFAILVVLPPRWWAPGGLLAAGYATATGVGTLVMTWHRPSDAVAAPLLVGATTALVLALHARYRRARPGAQEPTRLRDLRRARAAVVLLGTAAVLLAVTAVALIVVTGPQMSSDPDRFTRFLVYAGGAAGIGAVTCAVVAGLLVGLAAVTPRSTDADVRPWYGPRAGRQAPSEAR